ncbi:trimethylguanosine synthase [Nematocida major]|uniref:trimethylguanosine synthase n=1 Tax=Nematocida major TaxID=1912982 RepID=UPI0020074DDC|nr:trimethylguanosine synthase [Nematocida major]KAH9385289.1 trimethylguanosine synthase [Nematocida major]
MCRDKDKLVIRRKVGRWSVYDYTACAHPDLTKYIARMDKILPRARNNSFLLDRESWYSITPVALANSITEAVLSKFQTPVRVLDLFAGVGGNTISFLKYENSVDSVEIDYAKVRCLRHNVKMCTSADKHTVHHMDVFCPETLKKLRPSYEVLMASPPWGGICYKKCSDVELFRSCKVLEIEDIYASVASTRIYMLPRNLCNRVFALLGKPYLVFPGASFNGKTVAKILVVGDTSSFFL